MHTKASVTPMTLRFTCKQLMATLMFVLLLSFVSSLVTSLFHVPVVDVTKLLAEIPLQPASSLRRKTTIYLRFTVIFLFCFQGSYMIYVKQHLKCDSLEHLPPFYPFKSTLNYFLVKVLHS